MCGIRSDKVSGEFLEEYDHNFCLYECVWKQSFEECGCFPGFKNQI